MYTMRPLTLQWLTKECGQLCKEPPFGEGVTGEVVTCEFGEGVICEFGECIYGRLVKM